MEFIKRHPLLSIVSVLTVVVVVAFLVARLNESAEQLSIRALRNFNRGFRQQASSDISRALAIDPNDERALITAALISMSSGNLARAREYYSRIASPRLLDEHASFADAAMDLQHFELAEQVLTSVRSRRADHEKACTLLLQLYRMCYRKAEHRQFLFETMNKLGTHRNDADFLFGLFNAMNLTEFETRAYVEDLDHPDHLMRLTACVNTVRDGETELARSALQQLIIDRPDLIEAHGQLGMLLVQAEDIDGLREWFVALPPQSLMHPDCCCAAGVMFEGLAAPNDALACYRQALLVDYRHQETLNRLIALLEQSGDKNSVVQELQELSVWQGEFESLLMSRSKPNNLDLDADWGFSVLELLMQLEWLPEAKVWCSLFKEEDSARFVSQLTRIEDRMAKSLGGESDEVDWPAIAPILRSAGLPVPLSPEMLQEKQASLRDE